MGRNKDGGGLIGLVGKGVGFAVEYNQHRAQQKASREPSPYGDKNLAPSREQGDLRSERPRSLEVPSSGRLQTTNPFLDQQEKSSTTKSDYSSIQEDEAAWALDESDSNNGLPSYEESEKRDKNNSELAREIMSIDEKRSTSQMPFKHRPLPCPVILPQRRPGNKSRGFVRAYAPLLGECSGIDQETFLAFLKNFHKSSQASPIFGVIQISAGIAGFAPGAIAMVVTTAAGVAAQKGGEMHAKMRTNNFLDQINNDLFIPKGLFAMIVQYKNDAEENSSLARFGVGAATTDFDPNQAIAARTSGNGGTMQKFQAASGTTYGAVAMPEAAPLIFPEVDYSLKHEGPETFKDKTRDFKKFMGGYMDRRAQAKFAQENPDSSLALPEQQRAINSKYSDPNNAMFNGGLIGFASGGAISRRGLRPSNDGRGRGADDYQDPQTQMDRDSRGGRSSYRDNSRRSPSSSSDSSRSDSRRRYKDDKRRDKRDRDEGRYDNRDQNYDRDRSRNREKGGGGIRKMMQEGILYLMIVNMPSEAELDYARRQMGAAGRM